MVDSLLLFYKNQFPADSLSPSFSLWSKISKSFEFGNMVDCLSARSTQMKLFLKPSLKTKSTLFLNNGLFRSLLWAVFSKLLLPAEFTKSYHMEILLPPFQINPHATFSSGSIRDHRSISPLILCRQIRWHVLLSARLLCFIKRASSLSGNHNSPWFNSPLFPIRRFNLHIYFPLSPFFLINAQLYSSEIILPVDLIFTFYISHRIIYVLMFWLYLKKGNKPCLARKPSLKLGLVNKGRILTLEKYPRLLIFEYK